MDAEVNLLDISKSIVGSHLEVGGDVRKINIGGGISSTSSLDIGGDVSSFKVKKTIRDTTIISSMAAATDHIDHVRTQLPYALTAGLVAFIGFMILGATL